MTSEYNWNFNLDEAPKGKIVAVQRLVVDKDSASGKSLRTVEEYQADIVILASQCRKVIRSYWLPEEARWAGFKAGENPVAWQSWPEWPERMIAESEAFHKRFSDLQRPMKEAAE